MAYVIAVLNQKGGVAKSTLSTNLSTAYARRGRKTLLADADTQGTARNWRGFGPEPVPGKAFPDVVGADTVESIDTLTGDEITGAFDVVVIDGPPGVTEGPGEVTVGALKAADLVLLPVRPSGADLWATSDLADLVTTRQDATGNSGPGRPVWVPRGLHEGAGERRCRRRHSAGREGGGGDRSDCGRN